MYTTYEDDHTIPHVTRHDSLKTGLYASLGLLIAISLVIGTIWLFIAG